MAVNYLVPHDFTPVADAATQQAIQLARQTGASITLLHIIKKESEGLKAQQRFADILKALPSGEGAPNITTHIALGSIFEDISRIAEELHAQLIVMGTHGARGMQKVFGSYALKVITSAKAPFLIVQESVPSDKITKVVLPIDMTKESLQVMNVAVDVAKTYDAEVHIVGNYESDVSLAKKISAHLTVVLKNMSKNGVDTKVELLKGSGSLHHKVLEYATQVNADMIAIAYHSESLLPQFDRFAQSLLTNEKQIPVLIVNSKSVSNFYF